MWLRVWVTILGLGRGGVAGDGLRVGGLVELQVLRVLRVVGLGLRLGVVLVGHFGPGKRMRNTQQGSQGDLRVGSLWEQHSLDHLAGIAAGL